MAVNLLTSTEDHASGTYENFLIVIWRHSTPVQEARQLCENLAALARERGSEVHLISIVEDTARPPNAAARRALAAVLADNAKVVKSSSVIQEGNGFRASMVRSIVTGLAMLARPPFPHHVFPLVNDALAYHAEHAGIDYDSNLVLQLRQAIADLRQVLDDYPRASREKTSDKGRRMDRAVGGGA
ncbi:MAG: hypothetical protein OXR73_04375 [Myxococcales bacterium]|nr:hypothetical protein [Myxococcales bacterium]